MKEVEEEVEEEEEEGEEELGGGSTFPDEVWTAEKLLVATTPTTSSMLS